MFKKIKITSIVLVPVFFIGCNSGQPIVETKIEKPIQKEVVSYETKGSSPIVVKKPEIEIKKEYFENGKVSFERKIKNGIELEKIGFTYYDSGEIEYKAMYINDIKVTTK